MEETPTPTIVQVPKKPKIQDPYSNPKQCINWNFIVRDVDPSSHDSLQIPHDWMVFGVVFVCYQLERDIVNPPGFLLHGILRYERKVSTQRLITLLHLDPHHDDNITFTPYYGVLDTRYLHLELHTENRIDDHYYEFGTRFVPRQGQRTDLGPKEPNSYFIPYDIPSFITLPPPVRECTNRCKCCNQKGLLEQQVSTLKQQLDYMKHLYETEKQKTKKRKIFTEE